MHGDYDSIDEFEATEKEVELIAAQLQLTKIRELPNGREFSLGEGGDHGTSLTFHKEKQRATLHRWQY